jgi:hypothetical protein
MNLKSLWNRIVDYINDDYDPFSDPDIKTKKDPYDKYDEYAVDFHGLVDHSDEEVSEEDSTLDDWHTRHSDKNLDKFCDSHPSAPQCKVFDD